MPRPSLRLRSPLLVLGVLLAGSLFGAGCKQSNGDRCEVDRDCESNYCAPGGGTPNSICCDMFNLATCAVNVGTGGSGAAGSGTGGSGAAGSGAGGSGTGGSAGIGGASGTGGASGQGGAGGAASDASTDAPSDSASDAPTD